MTKFILATTIVLFAMACKNEKANTTIQQVVTQKSTSNIDLPPFPGAELKNLFENATYVDYIFHKLPFAISQDSKSGVQGNVAMVSQKSPVKYDSSCPSLGRQFFHIDGEIVWEAEVYFDKESGCAAYVFYRDKKPVYVSDITDNGKKFYLNLVNQSFQ